MKSKLILENGMVFEGTAFGYDAEAIGEVAFNTSMNGYQEIITDPASKGQILIMTYPLIGNYGINLDDSESDSPQIKALVVKEKCEFPNNFRCEFDLEDYLKSHKIIGIEGVDTRALTKVIRNEGSMKGIILPEGSSEDAKEIQQRLHAFSVDDATIQEETKEKYTLGKGKIKVAAFNLGATNSLLKSFADNDCTITVYPSNAKAEEILKDAFDFVLISNGSEIVHNLSSILVEIKTLAENKPTFAVGVGHELLALAFGGKLEKHLYGHRGNQPVKDLATGRVYTTTQNHNFHVSELPNSFVATHTNMNDNNIEGMKHSNLPIYSVQFYPEYPKNTAFNDGVIKNFLQSVAQEVQNA